MTPVGEHKYASPTMVTRIKWALLALFLALGAGCVNQQAQVDPLLAGMGELKQLFELEQRNTRELVASSNPPAAVFQAFVDAQAATYAGFLKVYGAMARQVASIGQFSAEDTAALLERITETILVIKGEDGDDQ